jgi:hypothetical protein
MNSNFAAIYEQCKDQVAAALMAAGCSIPGGSRYRPDRRGQFLNAITVGLLTVADAKIFITGTAANYEITIKDNKPQVKKLIDATPADGAHYNIIYDDPDTCQAAGSEAQQ